MRELLISPDNVRHREINADVDDLARSLENIGLQQPIVVKPRGSKYEILIGQRRYLAAKQLGWDMLEAKILPEDTSELEAKVLSFSENAQRRDLSPRDKAEVCAHLVQRLGSVRAVADKVGVSEGTVRRWLGYAAVPDGLKAMVEEGKITRPTATKIAQHVEDEGRALAIAQRVAELRPVGDVRERFLAAVQEYPDRPVEVIEQKAEEHREIKQITFDLPQRWSEIIARASEELSRDPNDIAMDATIDWLSRYNMGSIIYPEGS
jgi:ParB/RepB/Spo0J family partition protein